MWLSGMALKLFAWSRDLTSEELLRITPTKPGTFDTAATVGVLPLAIVIALCTAWAFPLLKRLTDRRLALVGSFLLALDPFLITYSKQIHLNALLAAFMLVSVLLLFDHLLNGKRASLIYSGAFAGLSLLTKSPALFLLPYTVLTLGAYRLALFQNPAWTARPKRGESPEHPPLRSLIDGLRADLVKLLVWVGTAAAVVVLLWPAMWIEPLDLLRTVGRQALFHVETSHENPIFFNNQVMARDPGLLFYLATMAWKTTLVTLPMACLGGLLSLFKPHQARYNWITWLTIAYVVFFVIQMGLGSWKQESYMVPAIAALDVLAALGLVRGTRALGRVRWRHGHRLDALVPWLPGALIGLALALQAGLTLARHPYYGTHHNALLGGSRTAQHVLPLQDQGEGLDLAAAYLNTLPRAQYSGVWIHSRNGLAFERKYEGLTTSVPDPRATYRVYYVNQVMRGLGSKEWAEAWERDRRAAPLWSVAFDGIPYVWIYGASPEEPAAGGPSYAVDYRLGDHIQLTGFRLSAGSVSPGNTLTIVLFWQSDGQVKDNYTVFCHLVSAGSELVAQHDGRPVLEIRPVPSWRADELLLDSHSLGLSADLALGRYALVVGMYDLKTLERVPTFDNAGVRLPMDAIVLTSIDVQ
jgi:hypothetical protein